jgi:Mg/Co/Ni transporter MgtE
VPVTEDGHLVGIVTGRDLRFETRHEDPVSAIMTPQGALVTVKEGASREEVVSLLHKHRIEKVLVVNDAFELQGADHRQGHPEGQGLPQGLPRPSGASALRRRGGRG